MGHELEQALARILERIRQDHFGGREAPVVSVSEGTGVQPDGSLRGEITVHIKCKDGTLAPLHTEPLDGITTESALRDAFSEALSKVLASHDSWPR